MAEVKNTIALRRKWAEHVQVIIDDGRRNVVAIPRVEKTLLKVNPEAYIPRYVSLGPYHHSYFGSSSGENSYHYGGLKIMSNAEVNKVNSVAAFWQNPSFDYNTSFSELVQMIEEMKPDMERFYDWQIMEGEYSKHFALMMAVDSSFLLCFLLNIFTRGGNIQLQYEDMIHSSLLFMCIMCDVMKLENQIPFSVLEKLAEALPLDCRQQLVASGRRVDSMQRSIECTGGCQYIECCDACRRMRGIPDGRQELNKVLENVCRYLCPFDLISMDTATKDITGPHFLGYMHAFVSPMLHMESNWDDDTPHQRNLFQKMKGCVESFFQMIVRIFFFQRSFDELFASVSEYHAGRLTKAGIKFKPLSVENSKILFDIYSGTLYLPAINLNVSNMTTEVFLRNMVALEFNDASRGYYVTRYVGLMRCLIDTSDDVRVLRHSHVIKSRLSCTNEDIAKMWDGICQPLLTGYRDIPIDLKYPFRRALFKDYMKKYFWRIVKEKLWEVGGFLSSWKFVTPMSGFIALVLTAIQTYCALADWLHSSKH